MPTRSKLTVAVLAGGTSPEREISLESGAAVASALSSAGHIVQIVDPAEVSIENYCWESMDACFIALHGTYGEDGQVQQVLSKRGVPYTGSDVETSRTAFSKSKSKIRFFLSQIPTPEFEIVNRYDSATQIISCANRIGYPLVVKPDQQGSSLGVFIVESESQLFDAVEVAFQFGESILLERAIPGTEWTVAVVGNDALPVIQIETAGEFFDFEAKYIDERTQYRFDFDGKPFDTDLIAKTGLKACQALGTSGIARVDLRLDSELRPWVLEVNTIPGFTDHSLVPKAAAQAGITFVELCERSLQLALEKHRPTSRLAG